ncbi:sigma-54-dependent transcriptional regulator [Acidimangrovimonas sediminis]|uniref:sigma-54-dependent transcriptional regulator n=1 Tax=Acidimangrovimonas sediminis TaxID=2056283 RepID=UPI000C8035C1|nr:sigma-54 dependent transcriptional regulator [Acidimangrovimonas sediminis]
MGPDPEHDDSRLGETGPETVPETVPEIAAGTETGAESGGETGAGGRTGAPGAGAAALPTGEGTGRGAGDGTGRLAGAAVLVVDDEPGMRNFLVKTLAPHCEHVAEAESTAAAEAELARRHFDVVVLDNMMPGQTGIDWLAARRRQGSLAETILITAYADLETAIGAMRAGAADFVLKPVRANQVLNAVRRCLEVAHLRHENALLRHELRATGVWRPRRDRLIGASPQIGAVREVLARVADLPSPVLIRGESGTGKEVAARHLHRLSARAARPFVAINCAAMPAETLEAELFGRPGAPAGEEGEAAGGGEGGLLASARGGTVFFDEIGEMPAAAQSALLRVLENRGGSAYDLRPLFSTTRDLPGEVRAGRFREDLYFRINVIEVEMPPLRQRGNDVLDLAELFMGELSAQLRLPARDLTPAARGAMLRHGWPGNIRELSNFVERALIFDRFPLEMLSPAQAAGAAAGIEPLDSVERRHILTALDAAGGNRTEAARRLGISRKTIDRKCAAWGL